MNNSLLFAKKSFHEGPEYTGYVKCIHVIKFVNFISKVTYNIVASIIRYKSIMRKMALMHELHCLVATF